MAEPVKTRILVCEDSLLVREGLERIVEGAPDLELVGSAGDLDTAFPLVEQAYPDVVLTDIRLPPTNTDEGIRFANELRESQPDVGVVVLSQYASPAYARSLLQRGADRRGYVLKRRVAEPKQLIQVVRIIAAGGSYLDPEILELVLGTERASPDHLAKLTPRESDVLGLVADGLSNEAIAGELLISKRGVERHINSIFAKLSIAESTGVSRRVKAAVAYIEARQQ